ncbi:bcl-2-like protein 10 isoform X4 [Heterocephalus glaber]|uniref:Bcl-2-like protein 10 isoform X4 n=1 Tax=Heterocephalus glaber TaxID=10181 RepID=A0AAX6T3Z3_HETGA|nr:bcl-2-like protein 10 isoform X4 [Heterocephalus glaber]
MSQEAGPSPTQSWALGFSARGTLSDDALRDASATAFRGTAAWTDEAPAKCWASFLWVRAAGTFQPAPFLNPGIPTAGAPSASQERSIGGSPGLKDEAVARAPPRAHSAPCRPSSRARRTPRPPRLALCDKQASGLQPGRSSLKGWLLSVLQ